LYLKTKFNSSLMIGSDYKIIAVDNEIGELEKIVNTFNNLRTTCLPILYNAGDEIIEKYSGVRIAFFDINFGLGNPSSDSDLCNIIASALKEVISPDNGPYALIFWSLHTDKLEIIKNYIEKREKNNIPRPLLINTIDKSAVVDNAEKLKTEVERVLSNSTLEAMLDYEEKARIAAADTINAVFSLIPHGSDKWGITTEFEKNFNSVFSKMSMDTLGFEHAKSNPKLAVQKALAPIFTYNSQKSLLSDNWNSLLTDLNEKIAKKIKFPNDFQVGYLNSIYHLYNGDDCSKGTRGIIIKSNIPDKGYQDFAKRKYSEILHDFIPFVENNIDNTKKKELRSRCECVFIEISALCDYTQQKPRMLKYILGLKFPSEVEEHIDRKHRSESIFVTPLFTLPNESFYIAVNFRFVIGMNIDDPKLGDIKFCLGEELVNQIGNRYASYVSRIGVISYQ
jgi:hypothetical protein